MNVSKAAAAVAEASGYSDWGRKNLRAELSKASTPEEFAHVLHESMCDLVVYESQAPELIGTYIPPCDHAKHEAHMLGKLMSHEYIAEHLR